MGNKATTASRIQETVPGFFNVRAHFTVAHLIDVGSHMSLIKRPDGKFIVIDTVPLENGLKEEIDALTRDGKDIEAVIATHPFHTLAFPGFYKEYPNAKYYGTPRHLRRLVDIPWAGDITENLTKFEPDIQLRIPAGCEWVAPEPEADNHFVTVWVFHPSGKMLHIDDSLMYFEKPPLLLRFVGFPAKEVFFHHSLEKYILKQRPDAGRLLSQWFQEIIRDWDFDNACVAHNGFILGGAKEAFINLYEKKKEIIESSSTAAPVQNPPPQDAVDEKKCSVENECG
jgi:hypothetical protein